MDDPSDCDTKLTPRKSPRKGGAACLVQIYPTGPGVGRRHELGGGSALLGRGEECLVQTDDPSVSRRHARLSPDGEGHTVQDLGSCNGTWVNDRQVTGTRTLRDGDSLRAGNCIYRYLAGGNVEAEYHEELYRLAIQDALTRLPNRRHLDEFLAREVIRSQRHARPLSVVLLDLDKFKSVNDNCGHLCGDAVLRDLAERLRSAVRAEDLAARYGGEEFALVLVETGHTDAVTAAERLRKAVADQPFQFESAILSLTVSVGVATTCGDADATATRLLRQADARLYRAKQDGRNRVISADDGEANLCDTVVAK